MAIFNKRATFELKQWSAHFQRRNSPLSILYSIIRFLVIIVENLYCIPSYLVLSWFVLLPTSWLRSDLYSKLENYLYNSLLFIVSSWSLAAGLTVVESGDEFKYLIEEHEKSYPIETEKSSYPVKNKVQATLAADSTNISNSNNNNNRINSNNSINSNGNPKRYLDTSNCRVIVNGYANRNLSRPLQVTEHSNINTRARSNGKVKNNEVPANGQTPKRLISNGHNQYGSMTIINERHSLKTAQAKPRILLLCNHISTADVPLMMQSFSTLTNQSILWVLDAQFKMTNFGVVCGSHGDFFVDKNSYADGALREHVLKYPDRNMVVLFPEGGFLRKRIEGSNRYATRNGLPHTQYVTHPRFGAFKDLIDPSVGITHIVDATLIYDDIKNPISILDIAFGNKKEPAIINFKVYNRSEITPDEEWLRKIWLEKDAFLARYYADKTGALRQLAETFRVATLDWFKVLSVHLFYLLVCYLAIFRIFNATSVTMLKARELYYSNI